MTCTLSPPLEQVLRQLLKRFPSAGYEDDVIARTGVAVRNGPTEARPRSEDCDGLGHDGHSHKSITQLT